MTKVQMLYSKGFSLIATTTLCVLSSVMMLLPISMDTKDLILVNASAIITMPLSCKQQLFTLMINCL